jgi:hypothetical protein
MVKNFIQKDILMLIGVAIKRFRYHVSGKLLSCVELELLCTCRADFLGVIVAVVVAVIAET